MKADPPIQQSLAKQDDPLAIVSMVLGVVSLTGPGLILGIPAIITAIIALKKNTNNRGLSIAGLVTGIVSTLFSLLLIAALTFAIIWMGSHPEEMKDPGSRHPQQSEQLFRSSEI